MKKKHILSEHIGHFCGTTDSHGLDFLRHLHLISRPGCIGTPHLPTLSRVHDTFLRFISECHTCRTPDRDYSAWYPFPACFSSRCRRTTLRQIEIKEINDYRHFSDKIWPARFWHQTQCNAYVACFGANLCVWLSTNCTPSSTRLRDLCWSFSTIWRLLGQNTKWRLRRRCQ